MKKLNVVVKEMSPSAIKRTEWREVKPGVLLGYRKVQYAGAIRMVPAVDEAGKQWSKPPTNAEGGQPGNQNAVKNEEPLTAELKIRCARSEKGNWVRAARPGKLSDWVRTHLNAAAQ